MKSKEVVTMSFVLARLGSVLCLTCLCFGALVTPAWAIQAHAGPEGLYVHQGAHIYLAFAMLIFALNIRRSHLARQKAWRLLTSSAVLFILWNIWAFVGHLSFFARVEESFIMESGHLAPSLPVTAWYQVGYYVLKMDHLLCVPALLCFYFGLKVLLKETSGLPRPEEARKT